MHRAGPFKLIDTMMRLLDPPIPEEVDDYIREILFNDFDAACEEGTALDVSEVFLALTAVSLPCVTVLNALKMVLNLCLISL